MFAIGPFEILFLLVLFVLPAALLIAAVVFAARSVGRRDRDDANPSV